ncbi:MAG: SulP family inorganic anion transporter [Flavobacteriales bacterium]
MKFWKEDLLAGFLVFILALPLSMGIAAASDFPPIYGLVTAMVGGVLVGLLAGSPLTIKGPAAGLIVIVAGAVSDFGGGETGWKLALGAIVVAGALQVVFGFLKLGKMSVYFPRDAVHGMLTAIGIIIISKQFHVLLGQNPTMSWLDPSLPEAAGKKPLSEPLELMEVIPHSIKQVNMNALWVGLVALVIVFVWAQLKSAWAKKIPGAIVALAAAIAFAKWIGMDASLYVKFDKNLADVLHYNVDFGGVSQLGTFIKYVMMFALVGTLEAMLTVNAMDMRDPWKRKSNVDKDIKALGLGNMLAGVLGGLPMISEVARSSANISNGARTQWANIYHGIFVLLFMLVATSVSGLIPKPALAALLIFVAYRLAHPSQFVHMWKLGKDQFFVFISTVVITLATDLLIGVSSGMVLKMIWYLASKVSWGELFGVKYQMISQDAVTTIQVESSLTFYNFPKLKNAIAQAIQKSDVVIHVGQARLIDHAVVEQLMEWNHHEHSSHQLSISGLEDFKQVSSHTHATRVHK